MKEFHPEPTLCHTEGLIKYAQYSVWRLASLVVPLRTHQNTVYMTVQEKIERDILGKSTTERGQSAPEMCQSDLVGISFRMAYKNRGDRSEFYSGFMGNDRIIGGDGSLIFSR